MVSDPYSVIGGIAGSALEAGIGYINTLETNKANQAIANATNESNKEIAAAANALQQDMFNAQMDYTRAVQQENWARADTQFQRAVADASAAGLSPLAVLENANNVGGIVSQPSAPSQHVPTMIGAQMSPMDPAYFGTFRDMARGFLDIIAQDKRLNSEEKLTKYKEEQANMRFEQQLRQTSALTNKRLNLENSRASQKLQEEIRQFNSTLELTVTENNRRYAEKQAEELTDYVRNLTGDISGAYRFFKGSFDEYRIELRKWGDWYSSAVSKITADYESDSYNHSSSLGASVGANSSFGANGNLSGAGFGVGLGGSSSNGANSSINDGSSTGESHTRSFSTYLRQRLASEMADNPYPVWESNPYYRANPYY